MSGMGERIGKHPVCSAGMGTKPDYQLMWNHLEQGLDSYRWGEKGNFHNCHYVSSPTKVPSLSKAAQLMQTSTLYCSWCAQACKGCQSGFHMRDETSCSLRKHELTQGMRWRLLWREWQQHWTIAGWGIPISTQFESAVLWTSIVISPNDFYKFVIFLPGFCRQRLLKILHVSMVSSSNLPPTVLRVP